MRNFAVRAGSILELEGGEMLPGAVEVAPRVEAAGWDGGGDELALELSEEGAGSFGGGLVLDDDVGMEGLFVLGDQVLGEAGGEFTVEVLKSGRGEGVGHAAAEGAEAGDLEVKGLLVGGGYCDGGANGVGVGEVMEQGEMGGDQVALGRKVEVAEGFEAVLGVGSESEGEDAGESLLLSGTR